MREANINEINIFKENYCRSEESRNKIMTEFTTVIDSFEEAIPWQEINSWATGNKKIGGSFIIFKVIDEEKQIFYNPVFSETVGKAMLKSENRIGELPDKINIFGAETNNGAVGNRTDGSQIRTNSNNRNLRILIMYIRTMMLLGVPNPKPMTGWFRELYEKLSKNPNLDVYESEIKSVNTALRKHLMKETITFNHLDEFLEYLANELNNRGVNKNLRTRSFQALREKFSSKYPDEELFF